MVLLHEPGTMDVINAGAARGGGVTCMSRIVDISNNGGLGGVQGRRLPAP
jgi:hypothetical protein